MQALAQAREEEFIGDVMRLGRHYDKGIGYTRFKGGAQVGEGALWSADRATAWRVSDGKPGEKISLEEAARIAERVGLPVPGAVA